MYAEDLPYWNTETSLARNQERIERVLDSFGAEAIMTTQGRKGDQVLWMIRFQFKGLAYRFEYQPYPMKGTDPIKRRPRIEQAIMQMSARAYHEIKAVLTAAAFEQDRETPRALYGYLELRDDGSGRPPRASDLSPIELAARLELPTVPALPERSSDV